MATNKIMKNTMKSNTLQLSLYGTPFTAKVINAQNFT